MLEKRFFMALSCPWKRFKKGFTLAEVLITLSIIGVVAALTMPSVISNHKTRVQSQQLKKAYSTITNAVNLVQSEIGQFPNCYYRSDGSTIDDTHFTECNEMWALIASKLNVVKTCNGNGLAGGCLPEYGLPDTAPGCPFYSKANVNNRSNVYVLADGVIIYTYGSGSGSGLRSYFRMDVNGKKGPNWGGHDVFSFRIAEEGKSIKVFTNGCGYLENGGIGVDKRLLGIEE